MRKLFAVVLILLGAWLAANRSVHAQVSGSTQMPVICYQVMHTTCTITAGVTTHAICGDGYWRSLNGGAWVQIDVPVVPGVSSVTVNGGTPQTGAVVLTVPTKATTTLQ